MIPGIVAGAPVSVGPPPTPYRWYRLYITANNGDTYTGLNELLLRETPGGTDYPAPPTNVITNPTDALTAASANSFYFANPPAQAFDQDYGSLMSWYNNGDGTPCWLKYDLGAGNETVVREFGIVRAPGEEVVANRWPQNFQLQGSNDDSTWDVLKTVTGQVGWSSDPYQVRLYSVP